MTPELQAQADGTYERLSRDGYHVLAIAFRPVESGRSSLAPAFDTNGTVTIYDKLPPQDQYPSYPEKDYH